MNNEYIFTEYRKGKRRHIFRKITDKNVFKPTDKDVFKSIFLHSKELKEFYNKTFTIEGKNTLSGYNKSVYADCVTFDIDHKNLNISLEIARKFLQHLLHNYEIEPSWLSVNFSGSKGFHIRIPAELFGGFTPSSHLHKQIKSIAEKLTDGFENFDYTIYKRIGFIRVENTINSKTGLLAIPLTSDEVLKLTMDEIKTLAEEIRSVEMMSPDELNSNEFLVELKLESEKIETQDDGSDEDEIDNTNYDAIWMNRAVGGRHEQVGIITGHLMNYDLPNKSIEKIVRFWNLGNKDKKMPKEISEYVNGFLKTYKNEEQEYWKITRIARGKGNVKIKMHNYMQFLEEQGFAKKYLDRDYVFIRSVENIVEEIELSKIKDFILDHIKNYYKDDSYFKEALLNELLDKNRKYFGKGLIECIPSIDLNVLRDKKDESNFYFRNGFARVTRDNGITLHNYPELEGKIWKSHIIQRDFKLVIDERKSVYEQFLFNVAGQSNDRLKTIKSSIGYLLHGYKDSGNAKVIVLVDEKITENGEPNGRTGKSVFGKALSKIKKSSRFDGKNFTFTERFTFQQVYLDTKILEFNDVKRDFDFERLFSVTTDDMTIENKGEKPFTLCFDDSPKIMVSTNYTIKGQGASFEDRLFEIEFSDYYNEKHKPKDDFGKLFFDEWDEDEWNRFDNFMLECVELYLKEGLVEYEQINLPRKKLISKTSQDFIEFAEISISINWEYDKRIMYEDFKLQYSYHSLSQRKFTIWTKTYSDYFGYKYETRESSGRSIFRLEDGSGDPVVKIGEDKAKKVAEIKADLFD